MPAGSGGHGARWTRVGRALSVILLGFVAVACSSSAAAPRGTSEPGAPPTTAPPASSAPTSAATAAHLGLSRVDMFGDSLMVQAANALRVEGRAHHLDVTVGAYYGLAPCDLVPSILADLVKPPRALVLAFSGNNITPCIAPGNKGLTGAAYYAEYQRDIGIVVADATRRKVPVLVVAPPPLGAAKNVPDRVPLDALYRAIVARYPGARYVATAAALGGAAFTKSMPCVAGETAALGCHNGEISVRNPDEIHFDEPRSVPCPTGNDSCQYSAGAHRYSDAIFRALATVPGLSYRSAPTVDVPVDITTEARQG